MKRWMYAAAFIVAGIILLYFAYAISNDDVATGYENGIAIAAAILVILLVFMRLRRKKRKQ